MIVEKIYNRNAICHKLILFRNTGRATKISFENILNGKIVVARAYMRSTTDIMLTNILTDDVYYLNFYRISFSVYSVAFNEEEKTILSLHGADI